MNLRISEFLCPHRKFLFTHLLFLWCLQGLRALSLQQLGVHEEFVEFGVAQGQMFRDLIDARVRVVIAQVTFLKG